MTFASLFPYGVFGVICIVLAIIALNDGRKFTITLGDTFLIVVLACLYKSLTGTLEEDIGPSLMAAGAGAGIVYAAIFLASCFNKRPPVFSGDAWLFAATGFLLGPTSLALVFILNFPLALAYRYWLAKKRNRPMWRSYAPVAPPFCLAAGLVFLNDSFDFTGTFSSLFWRTLWS